MTKVELNVNCLHGNIWDIVELSENIVKSMWNDVKIIKNSTKTAEKVENKKNKAILSNDNVK